LRFKVRVQDYYRLKVLDSGLKIKDLGLRIWTLGFRV
jgi:hypothetical protein